MQSKAWILFLAPVATWAQTPEMNDILARLQRLEQQNQELLSEIRSLRDQVARHNAGPQPASPPPAEVELAERVSVQESRTADLSASKVESDHRQPLTLTGMLLFNAFQNQRFNGDTGNPVVASLTPAASTGGATLRQSTLGLKFHGPSLPGGGSVNGAVYMDFFGGTGTPLNQLLRIRIATVNLTWANTTVSVGQEKPLIAPREPESLAQVGVSPLTGAGNLWLWQPQASVEQRFKFGQSAGLRAQVGVFQTAEGAAGVPAEYSATLSRGRPGLEGRFVFWRGGESRLIEIAPGFHVSNSRLLGVSVPSRVYSVDWLVRPFSRIDFTGTFFGGENVDVLGGLRQGITVFDGPQPTPRAVRAYGGWAQLGWRATGRLSFHVYGGLEDSRNADLRPGAIGQNQAYAANLMYRLTQNVIASFESSRVRTNYLGSKIRQNVHHDIAVAYLF